LSAMPRSSRKVESVSNMENTYQFPYHEAA